jgi:hypothetical protein
VQSSTWPACGKTTARFLDDPNVTIDNNGTKRRLHGVVIGRKNHYGSLTTRNGTPRLDPRILPRFRFPNKTSQR